MTILKLSLLPVFFFAIAPVTSNASGTQIPGNTVADLQAIPWGRPAVPDEIYYRKFSFAQLFADEINAEVNKQFAKMKMRIDTDQEFSFRHDMVVNDSICRVLDDQGNELGKGQVRAEGKFKLAGNIATITESAEQVTQVLVPARNGSFPCLAAVPPVNFAFRTDGKELRIYLTAEHFFAAKP